MADPTIPAAFGAGLISFLSPCVLPLVPGYLSYMSGLGPGVDGGARVARTTSAAAFFVLGFSAVFVALGASATLLGSLLREHRTGLSQVAGVFIIVMGLVFLGALRIPWLYREARFHPTPQAGAWGSLLLGGAFALGWSPCIGATLAPILVMAAGRGISGGPGEGALLLGVYSLGLGVPFILAGLGVSHLAGAVKWLRRHARSVNVVSGTLLIGVGVLLATDRLFQIAVAMQRLFIDLNLEFLARI